ncbi:MAG TPA: DNA polymerase/3'-5' exonuclease PolX [Chitinispirillaceae bacterium]|nr:DNA polymerase/3'-5' exonuclease PolX [Chitinispirillaceae bacterium]
MRIRNTAIAEMFNDMADLLEIKGDNPFRVRAYRTAAHTIYGLSNDVTELLENGEDLSRLPGIGKDLASKINQIIITGHFEVLENLKKEIPSELIVLMKIEGLGGRRIKTINEKLGVNNVEQLEKAALDHKICKLPGFGEKIEKSILDGIKQVKESLIRIKLYDAEEIVNRVKKFLKSEKAIDKLIVAGSFRRRRETVRDIDILITTDEPLKIIRQFQKFPEIKKVLVKGETRCTVILDSSIQVDIRVVAGENYGAALHYFTGSKAHNIAIRKMGLKLGLKINEYGIWKGDRRIAGEFEEDVYRSVGLPFIEPELREDNGELDAAKSDGLPKLINTEQIRGDLHTHTLRTDGHASMEQMVNAARLLGYEYMAVTDHSQRLAMTHGLTEKDLAEQIAIIDKLNESLVGFRVLKGIEVDILEDGSLDLPDSILKELDLTVCSVHSKLNLSRRQQTQRVLRAMENPYFTILAHPTGRLINRRPPFEIDMEKILQKAKEFHRIVEVNSYPERLDMNDLHCRMAKEMGVKVSINTDAHSTNDLNFMRFGVAQARRGWLETSDVVNTRGLKDLMLLLQNK